MSEEEEEEERKEGRGASSKAPRIRLDCVERVALAQKMVSARPYIFKRKNTNAPEGTLSRSSVLQMICDELRQHNAKLSTLTVKKMQDQWKKMTDEMGKGVEAFKTKWMQSGTEALKDEAVKLMQSYMQMEADFKLKDKAAKAAEREKAIKHRAAVLAEKKKLVQNERTSRAMDYDDHASAAFFKSIGYEGLGENTSPLSATSPNQADDKDGTKDDSFATRGGRRGEEDKDMKSTSRSSCSPYGNEAPSEEDTGSKRKRGGKSPSVRTSKALVFDSIEKYIGDSQERGERFMKMQQGSLEALTVLQGQVITMNEQMQAQQESMKSITDTMLTQQEALISLLQKR